ncbi:MULTISPECIES: hypothetical protein [unclassified Achromobacter]|uniref:hypothetical protein n=1 Tax=unclassified Achromobacter TaxID=2626865 RepID=UPI000B517330|nr:MULTISPECIES: hypothetical protein [unclassified Achromobacter]OWT68847.1 hypothetical protein CEY04_29065 [Achromobacter sp. HZ28]OWT78590.1 hypothetical protein CEY05_11985 [Achromobacter sp. HZ34]
MKPHFFFSSVARRATVATLAAVSVVVLAAPFLPGQADAAVMGPSADLAVSFTIQSTCSVQSRDLLRQPQAGPDVTCLHDEVSNIAMQSALPSATAVDTAAANGAAPENESAATGAANAAIGAATWVVTF